MSLGTSLPYCVLVCTIEEFHLKHLTFLSERDRNMIGQLWLKSDEEIVLLSSFWLISPHCCTASVFDLSHVYVVTWTCISWDALSVDSDTKPFALLRRKTKQINEEGPQSPVHCPFWGRSRKSNLLAAACDQTTFSDDCFYDTNLIIRIFKKKQNKQEVCVNCRCSQSKSDSVFLALNLRKVNLKFGHKKAARIITECCKHPQNLQRTGFSGPPSHLFLLVHYFVSPGFPTFDAWVLCTTISPLWCCPICELYINKIMKPLKCVILLCVLTVKLAQTNEMNVWCHVGMLVFESIGHLKLRIIGRLTMRCVPIAHPLWSLPFPLQQNWHVTESSYIPLRFVSALVDANTRVTIEVSTPAVNEGDTFTVECTVRHMGGNFLQINKVGTSKKLQSELWEDYALAMRDFRQWLFPGAVDLFQCTVKTWGQLTFGGGQRFQKNKQTWSNNLFKICLSVNFVTSLDPTKVNLDFMPEPPVRLSWCSKQPQVVVFLVLPSIKPMKQIFVRFQRIPGANEGEYALTATISTNLALEPPYDPYNDRYEATLVSDDEKNKITVFRLTVKGSFQTPSTSVFEKANAQCDFVQERFSVGACSSFRIRSMILGLSFSLKSAALVLGHGRFSDLALLMCLDVQSIHAWVKSWRLLQKRR